METIKCLYIKFVISAYLQQQHFIYQFLQRFVTINKTYIIVFSTCR